MPKAKPDAALVDQMRKHRAGLHSWQTLYPYAMGRIDGVLDNPLLKPAQQVATIRGIISALDQVEREPRQPREPEPMQCPDCGMGSPGHNSGCPRAPVATLGPRS